MCYWMSMQLDKSTIYGTLYYPGMQLDKGTIYCKVYKFFNGYSILSLMYASQMKWNIFMYLHS